MLFMVGIETPENDSCAWGIEVPVFERIGLGCTSAADKEGDILNQATSAILTMAEVAMEQGILLDELAEPYHDYSKDENYSHCSRWIALDIDLSAISDKQQRLNISLSQALIARIDAMVEANRGEYRDRSHFLALAASHEIQNRNRF